MTYSEVYKEIRIYVEAEMAKTYWTTASVKHTYTNRSFPSGAEPDAETSWLRFDIVGGVAESLEIGRTGVGQRSGVLNVDIFTSKIPEFKESIAEAHAVQVEAMFRLKNINGVEFREPNTRSITFINDDTYVHHRTTIPFVTFVGE